MALALLVFLFLWKPYSRTERQVITFLFQYLRPPSRRGVGVGCGMNVVLLGEQDLRAAQSCFALKK